MFQPAVFPFQDADLEAIRQKRMMELAGAQVRRAKNNRD